MNYFKNILRPLHFVPFQIMRCRWAIRAWDDCYGCRQPSRSNAFKSLIYVFVFIPFFLKPLPSSAFEIMDKCGHSRLMFGELAQDEKIQCSISRFDLLDSVIESRRESSIGFYIFIAPRTPKREPMNGNVAEQYNTSGNEGDYDWSIYVAILPMGCSLCSLGSPCNLTTELSGTVSLHSLESCRLG